MKIVADSGPIISFARAGRLDLLKQVTNELTIPDAVFEEIVASGADRPGTKEVNQGSWIKRATVQDRSLLEKMPGKLSRGESEAILLAKELGAYLLVDELEARKEASRLGISYFGSLRIIKEAKDRGLISKAKSILAELIASSTYLDESLYKRFLREMGERGRGPAEEVSQYAYQATIIRRRSHETESLTQRRPENNPCSMASDER